MNRWLCDLEDTNGMTFSEQQALTKELVLEAMEQEAEGGAEASLV